jgi:hypothetical protein
VHSFQFEKGDKNAKVIEGLLSYCLKVHQNHKLEIEKTGGKQIKEKTK